MMFSLFSSSCRIGLLSTCTSAFKRLKIRIGAGAESAVDVELEFAVDVLGVVLPDTWLLPELPWLPVLHPVKTEAARTAVRESAIAFFIFIFLPPVKVISCSNCGTRCIGNVRLAQFHHMIVERKYK